MAEFLPVITILSACIVLFLVLLAIVSVYERPGRYRAEIAELKKQLEEKDKEIERQRKLHNMGSGLAELTVTQTLLLELQRLAATIRMCRNTPP